MERYMDKFKKRKRQTMNNLPLCLCEPASDGPYELIVGIYTSVLYRPDNRLIHQDILPPTSRHT